MLRRVVTFWLASLLAAAAIAAYEVFLLHHVEPDFGAPPGSFTVDFGIFAFFGLVGAICHGFAALLLRSAAGSPSSASAVLAASLSAFAFELLVYALPLTLFNHLPTLMPLLGAIGLMVSALVLFVTARLTRHSYGGAA